MRLMVALDKRGFVYVWRAGQLSDTKEEIRHYGVKEKKNTHHCFNNPPSAHSKGKKRGGPRPEFL